MSRAPSYALWALVLYFVLEYVRPPLITQLKLQMLIALLLPILWLFGPRTWSPVMTGQVAMLLWCAKAIPFAWNTYAAYFVTRMMYGHVAVGIVMTWICSSLRDFKRILWIWLVIIVYQAVWASLHGGRGMGGFMHDENDLALACVIALPLAFFGFERLAGRARWACAVALGILVVAVVVSFSRGGFVGLAVASLYCFFGAKRKFGFVVLGAVAAIGIVVLAPAEYIDEIRSIQQTDEGTARGRRFLWTAAINMWKDRPIVGWGGGNVAFLVGRYQPEGWGGRQYQERDWSGTTVHSAYFELLPEQGLVGVGIFAFLIMLQFKRMRSLRRMVGEAKDVPRSLARDCELYTRALNGMLVGYMVTGVFISVLYYPYFWYLTALSGAFDLAVRSEVRTIRLQRKLEVAEPNVRAGQ
jgi:O-antigen ligase